MNREDGSVSVVAAAIAAAIVMLALCAADLAKALDVASKAQTAADAAALAAAQELAIPGGREPSDLAAEYADRNGAELRSCTCDAGTYEATVVVRVPIGDLIVLGDGRAVEATARAVVDLDGPTG
ncbi:MAG TPA: Rv3654c family TadE-like protein [Actinomycetota bacterium]|nr:Rv3654c family TadE-like protein [Actinomycetota bacterium]